MEQETKPVVLNSYSQPHVLQQRMHEQHLSHGDRVLADIAPIRIEDNFGKFMMYFCPAQFISIREKLEIGDFAAIPSEAIIEGFELPKNFKPGLYTLKNVELFSNGTIQVIATAETQFEII